MIIAEDILNQMVRPDAWTGWVPTYTGKGYRPWSDNPGVVSLADIAWGLAHTYRYGGHTDPAITVAEHSLMAAKIIETLWPGDRMVAAAGLFHDASESPLHDIQGPLRKSVNVTLPSGEVISWDESDRRVTRNIAKHYWITPELLDDPRIKAADILTVVIEKRDCKNLGDEDWGLPKLPDEIAHISVVGYTPDGAHLLWVDRARELLHLS